MTKREMYLKAIRNEAVDELIWAPNFDYWLTLNKADGTLPEKYVGMSRNDIVRSIGASIWNRAQGFEVIYDGVEGVTVDDGERRIHEFKTPIGTIRQAYIPTEGKNSSMFLEEHFVKNLDDLKVMQYVVESMQFKPTHELVEKALAETGDDGIVLTGVFCVPFIQFAKTDAGYMNGFYMWSDHKKEVDRLLSAYHRKFLEGYSVLASGPTDVVATGDNMDGVMISPDIFREYAIPFYQEAKKICSEKGKIFEGHWCGRTQNLLDLVPGCGLDVVEAIVTRPMADIELSEALDRLRGEVVLQGGLPAVLVCNEGGTFEDFANYIHEVILPLRGRRGFILGMSDNVPPNADFSRVEAVAELIK